MCALGATYYPVDPHNFTLPYCKVSYPLAAVPTELARLPRVVVVSVSAFL
jgi:hypothetical protein